MDASTYAELRLIIARLWKDIEEGFEDIPREYFWWKLSRDPLNPNKKRTSDDFRLSVPVKNRSSWLKAMNILSRFDVFIFCLLAKDGQLVQYHSLDEDPEDELYYTMSYFKIEKFADFCKRFGFDLKHPILETHKATLRINIDNVPIITVENTKFHLKPLNKSTLVEMLKIALQPSLRDVPLNKERLNKEGGDAVVIAKVLGGEKFHLPDTVTRLRKYRTEIKFPEILDQFYFLNDKAILGKSSVDITNEQLEEIQEATEYAEPLTVKKKYKP